MPFRKKNNQVDAPTPHDVADLGQKHEVAAAKDRKSSVYQHFHSQEEALLIAAAKKRKKLYAAILVGLLAILLVLYLVSMLLTQWGDLVISIGDLYDGKTIMLSESEAFDKAEVKLDGGSVKEVTNITKSWLPDNLDAERDGEHNGENYLAYTFYLKNTGDKDLEYETVMNVTGASKSADEAVRVMIYKNGEESVYAKGSFSDREQAEPDATKWVDETQILHDESTELKAGSTDKYTVVIWCEGNDPECVDAIRGGHVRANMIFNVVPENKEQ